MSGTEKNLPSCRPDSDNRSNAIHGLCLRGAATSVAQERPWSVSPCELLKHPGMYDETMVSVPGLVLYGGQEFTTHSYDCPDEYGVLRLEFGGNPTDPKDQFRLPQARLEAGTVPLKKDADYETTQRLMKSIDASGRIQMLRATLIGRFFAGQAVGTKSGEIKHPNAHLVISEVEIVSNKPEDAVDFSTDPHLATRHLQRLLRYFHGRARHATTPTNSSA